jgi:septum formation protein
MRKEAGRDVPAFLFQFMTHLILASQSPRRHSLLAIAGYPFVVKAANVDEDSVLTADPAQNSLDTARLKARATAMDMAHPLDRTLILAADTTVALGPEMFGKPVNAADARRMLIALRGRVHEVHTGMTLLDPVGGAELTAVHTAVVTMRDYSNADIERYIATGDPFDKAGSYAIQHDTFQPVAALQGCFPSVMGLCICQVHLLLNEFGLPSRTDMAALEEAHNGFRCALYDKIARKQSK